MNINKHDTIFVTFPHWQYQMFRQYGWTRAGGFGLRHGSCGDAIHSIREAFIDRDILMSEWVLFDDEAFTEDLIRATVANLKRRARGQYIHIRKYRYIHKHVHTYRGYYCD